MENSCSKKKDMLISDCRGMTQILDGEFLNCEKVIFGCLHKFSCEASKFVLIIKSNVITF